MVEQTRPMRARRARQRKEEIGEVTVPIAAALEPEPKAPRNWRRVRTVLLAVVLGILVLAASVFAGGYLGLYRGEVARRQVRMEEAAAHYQDGLERLNSGEYELAIADFERTLELSPDHPLAQQGIAEAKVGIANRPTPTAEVYDLVAADLYAEALAHYEAGRWEEAATKLLQLRALDSGYEAAAVEEKLFGSLYNAGLALLGQDRLEEGIFYLDQAVALRPLDENALLQRGWAVKYMTALGYWGVDWEHCIIRFEELYALAPNYKDVFQRLYAAHVAYGDAWYTQEEMCPAEEQYTLALQFINDAQVDQKRAEAAEYCASATPTPIAPIEGTQTITMTELPPGFTIGRLAYPVHNTETTLYDLYALFADRRLVRIATGADQPSWVASTGALAYRDHSTQGISLLASEWGAPQQLVGGAGLAWPTFSPDGSRFAYAAQEVAGTWQIYIAAAGGSTEAVIHASGQGPVWGPNGWLAWHGCETGGACGIIIDNPDDDQPPRRLSSGTNDIGLNWSPDGSNLVYMSNHTGNWEVYQAGVAGGFTQLTDDPGADGLPAWAPDGSALAFVSNRDGAWGIYLMGPDGEDPHKILDLGPNLPDWTEQRLSWGP
jgi:tetratricopeptide (TPR) repeat protein